ncbi:MAG: hypothetical protein PVG48_01965 [Candidatus Bathyarchaeota archaeon]|jgi:hypothetical protein
MVKKAVLLMRLVEESVERTNEEIEREIFEELSEGLSKIPWVAKVKKVTVSENS